MKKLSLVITLLFLVILLSACGLPEEPSEVQEYCEELYKTDFADYPHAFIGACVSSIQTGNSNAFIGLCGSPAFRDALNADHGENLETRQECIAFLRNFEE